jgi:hypothetical protein
MSNAEHRGRFIVRYPTGLPVDIAPDLDLQIAPVLGDLRTGKPLRDLVKRGCNGDPRFTASESTWSECIRELFSNNAGRDVGYKEYRESLIATLELLGADKPPDLIWIEARKLIVDKIDVLSGWSRSPFARPSIWGKIQRRGDKYYTTIDGEEAEVVGALTEEETRWDFIHDDATRQYGLLRNLLRFIALRNICRDYRQNPNRYPQFIILLLPESNDGFASYLHWSWYVPRPYKRKALLWRPDCNQCDPEYLINDLIAHFADREHIPERDAALHDVSEQARDFHETTKEYGYQVEIALETLLVFGRTAEVAFRFRGQPVLWINQTPFMLTTLIVPCHTHNDSKAAYQFALEFVSALVYERDMPIRTITSIGGGRCPLPRLRQPPQGLGRIIHEPGQIECGYARGSSRALATALYAEGINSGSVYYAFLNYWKILELACGGKSSKIQAWINQNVADVRHLSTRVDELKKTEKNIGKYLYESNRCAVAHARSKTSHAANPDDPKDRLRISSDLQVIKALSRKAIDDGLLSSTEEKLDASPEVA